jgi:reactive intermediate/imine deaminase
VTNEDTDMTRQIINTPDAPAAIGTYSQAVRVGPTVYISGQIPLDPATGQLVSGEIEVEIRRVFDNLKAVAAAAGGSLAHAVRVTIYLTDLANFAKVNEIMAQYLPQPWPSRVTVGVSQLPRGSRVEIDCILHLD